MKQKKVCIAICIIVFVVAVLIVIYPLASNYLVEKKQRKVYTEYFENIEKYSNEDIYREKQKAIEYNEKQRSEENYRKVLNIGDNGIMGYVKIPQIDVVLPIYHGTTAEVLEKGVGHLFGSSLPIGGIGTHCVLTGHSGMSGQKMFSDLDCLKKGDIFYIDVLDETLEYRIEDVYVIEPNETKSLRVDTAKDVCSLVTCTPFGVNTHRLVIRGERIEKCADLTQNEKCADLAQNKNRPNSTWEREYIKGVFWGAIIVVNIVLLQRIYKKIKKRNK